MKNFNTRMRESEVEKEVTKYAASLGVVVRKFKTPGRVNAPDKIFLYTGRTMFIEFKSPGEKPRKGQIEEASILKNAGFGVYFVDEIQHGFDIIDDFIRR